jgi:hypothetical protein
MNVESVAVRMLPDGRMRAKDAAAYIGKAPKTLALMRVDGTGPRYMRCGQVYYFKDDLDEWIRQNARVRSTSEERQRRR